MTQESAVATTMGRPTMDWKSRYAEYGPTKFEFRKLSPIPAYHAFEEIRPHIGTVLATFDSRELLNTFREVQTAGGTEALTETENIEAMSELIKAIGAILSKLPAQPVEKLRQTLMDRVLFTNKSAPRPTAVSRNPDTAFMDLEAIHVYYVLIQAAIVNFAKSFSDVASLFQAETPEKDGSPSATAT